MKIKINKTKFIITIIGLMFLSCSITDSSNSNDDIIKLSATSKDAYTNPPITTEISGTGIGTQSLSLVNPSLFVVGNSDFVFDIVDTSSSLFVC